MSSPPQIGAGNDDFWCRSEPPFRLPLSRLADLPAGVRAITVEGQFFVSSGAAFGRPDRYLLRAEFGEEGGVELKPFAALERDFDFWATTLQGRSVEATGCLESGDGGAFVQGERSGGVLRIYAYAKIPERTRDRPPREIELSSLRDGAHEGQRVRVRGVLGGRRHRALPLSTRLSDADWVLASEDAAAWMRGLAPEGDGFRLDPDDANDQGRGLAVVGVVSWWREVPVLHLESVLLDGSRRRASVGILYTLPAGQRLDAGEAIEIRFSAAMEESSFEGRVELRGADGGAVAARWTYDAELWRLLVSPAADLPAGESLELRLLAGIVSSEGDDVRPESETETETETREELLLRRYQIASGGPAR